jgi:hypothetical protein
MTNSYLGASAGFGLGEYDVIAGPVGEVGLACVSARLRATCGVSEGEARKATAKRN